MTAESAPTKRKPPAALDATDRKLLALLAEDATRTYAELGRLLHLSAPALHECAKRLKHDGVVNCRGRGRGPVELVRVACALPSTGSRVSRTPAIIGIR
jgi:predicted transcriptional regulator